jgi:hypothetical protein
VQKSPNAHSYELMPTGPQSRRWPVNTALSGSGQALGEVSTGIHEFLNW